MLINLVAHTCVPQGVRSGGNCFVSVVSFISVALCRQTNVDSFVFAALLAALHWSAISFIINFHFSNFTANAQTYTHTHQHANTHNGREKNNAEFWLNCSKTVLGRPWVFGFIAAVPGTNKLCRILPQVVLLVNDDDGLSQL